jgi:hypothetical protein
LKKNSSFTVSEVVSIVRTAADSFANTPLN